MLNHTQLYNSFFKKASDFEKFIATKTLLKQEREHGLFITGRILQKGEEPIKALRLFLLVIGAYATGKAGDGHHKHRQKEGCNACNYCQSYGSGNTGHDKSNR